MRFGIRLKHIKIVIKASGTLTEVAHYTEAVDRRKLAHAGIEQERNFGNPVNPASENRKKPNKIKGKT